MSRERTAILIFARTASRDAAEKAMPGSLQIFEHLTGQALLKARRSGFPCFHFGDRLQRGNSFQERLGSAMQSLFDKGFENLVVIGNDSPDLSVSTLQKAAKALSGKRAVLGPDADGGTYLIGMHRSQFDYHAFLEFPWRQAQLFDAMCRWLEKRCKADLLILDCQMDMDSLEDLRNWSSRPAPHLKRLFRLIAGLFGDSPRPSAAGDAPPSEGAYLFFRFNKGSPLSPLRFS